MSKYDTIKQGLIDKGFSVNEEELFTFERVSQNHIVINGQHAIQEQKHIFQMKYIGDGIELDSENNEIEGSEFCGFDVLDEEGHSITTIYVQELEQFRHFLRLW